MDYCERLLISLFKLEKLNLAEIATEFWTRILLRLPSAEPLRY